MATAIFCDIDAFDLSDDCAKTLWEEWCERLDQFFIVNGLDKTNGTDKDKCRAIFLSRVGSKTYSLIRTLCHPDKPHDKTLDALQKLVKDHLSPEPIVIAERFVFLNRRQTTGETAAEFLNSLRKLAETCDFGTFRDQALRDMFVIGMNDHDTQQRLLGEKNLTLENAFNQAQNAERTKSMSVISQVKSTNFRCRVSITNLVLNLVTVVVKLFHVLALYVVRKAISRLNVHNGPIKQRIRRGQSINIRNGMYTM